MHSSPLAAVSASLTTNTEYQVRRREAEWAVFRVPREASLLRRLRVHWLSRFRCGASSNSHRLAQARSVQGDCCGACYVSQASMSIRRSLIALTCLESPLSTAHSNEALGGAWNPEPAAIGPPPLPNPHRLRSTSCFKGRSIFPPAWRCASRAAEIHSHGARGL
ncbi:hypothetical protein ANO11243_041830 [Dothideomycetidae sp. 11243]|nr:hypothetical protein ANO11243_041830 [fungal sp. No.11243]